MLRRTDVFGEKVRVIPLKGRTAITTLEQAQELWNQTNGKNKIRIVRPNSGDNAPGLPQKTISPEAKVVPQAEAKGKEARKAVILQRDGKQVAIRDEPAPVGRFASTLLRVQEGQSNSTVESSSSEAGAAQSKTTEAEEQSGADDEGKGSDIVIMQGPAGLIVTSDDKAALEQFDRLLRMLSEQNGLGSGEPTVVYLKHVKAAAAKELLETIMSGSTSSSGGGGSLLGDLAGGVMGGGMFGALLGGGGGGSGSSVLSSSTGMASGDYTITADPRLNCLIINASPQDMALCEELLKVIDQVESPESIETKGQVALIPVITQDVSQVLSTLKTLYADRIEGAAAAGGGGGNRQPDPREFIEALRGGGGGGRGGRGGASSELKSPRSRSAPIRTQIP